MQTRDKAEEKRDLELEADTKRIKFVQPPGISFRMFSFSHTWAAAYMVYNRSIENQ
jgi:hypothetical protein